MHADAECAVVGRVGEKGKVRDEGRQRGGSDGERELGYHAYSQIGEIPER